MFALIALVLHWLTDSGASNHAYACLRVSFNWQQYRLIKSTLYLKWSWLVTFNKYVITLNSWTSIINLDDDTIIVAVKGILSGSKEVQSWKIDKYFRIRSQLVCVFSLNKRQNMLYFSIHTSRPWADYRPCPPPPPPPQGEFSGLWLQYVAFRKKWLQHSVGA